MPLSADPAATVPFRYEQITGNVLSLATRFLTSRQKSEHRRLMDSIATQTLDDESILPVIRQALSIGIVGSVDDLESTLTRRELIHLATTYPAASEVAELEMGKSKSRRLTLVDTSVSASDASAASASIPQPQPIPSDGGAPVA